MIWLKVLRGLVTGGEKALGWLIRRVRRAPAASVERDDFALWEAECATFLQRLANRIKR